MMIIEFDKKNTVAFMISGLSSDIYIYRINNNYPHSLRIKLSYMLGI